MTSISALGTIRVRHCLKLIDGKLALSDLKTEASKRTYNMPAAVATSLRSLKAEQAGHKLALGAAYYDDGLVFCNEAGRPVRRQHIHRGFAKACEQAGIGAYIPRECRHTFVSVLDNAGMSIEQISAAVGHVNSNVTRQVYRHVLADQISAAATARDAITGTEATS